jgi:ketosteroid isomerase-like protein
MDEHTPLAAAIWQQEVAYWDYLLAGDIDGYMTLWHEDVAAWPNNRAAPQGKAGVRRHMAGLIGAIDRNTIAIDLKPVAIATFGPDLGVVHYELHLQAETTTGPVTVHERLCHTWQRSGESWQIIGGMSAPLDAP